MQKTPHSNQFSDFNFSAALHAVIKAAGYSTPTDVQVRAIPPILEGRDVLAGAETGSGKTAAFALPLLEKLNQQKQYDTYNVARGNHIRALILVPTRELALQISETLNSYAQQLSPKIKALAVFGGVKINPQMMALRGGADILVATPGRLLDLHTHNAIKFNKLQTLILDEVDRLVGEGFKDEIEQVFKYLPNQRQNLMFTATFPNSIRYLIRHLLKQPVIINIDPSDKILIDQRVFTVNYDKKNDLLAHLLNTYDWKQILIFCSAKKSCDNLVKKLEKRDISAVAMHSNKEQRARNKALREFKAGETRVLIATDVAARGLDIEELPCVINFELPRSPNDYTHRIGRTGRAGEKGFAISLIAHHEYAHFAVIEKRGGVVLKREQVAGFEADAVAPTMPARVKPKKKSRTKLSKKKRQRLQDKKVQQKLDAKIAPQKISKKIVEEVIVTPPPKAKVPTNTRSANQPPRKNQVATNRSANQPLRKNQVATASRSANQPPRKNQVAANHSTKQSPRKDQAATMVSKQSSNSTSPYKTKISTNTPYSTKPKATKNGSVWGNMDNTTSKPTQKSQPVAKKTEVKPTTIKKSIPQTPSKKIVKGNNASLWGEVVERQKVDK
jgi:superfamily II DNA/RNA helicase